MKLLDRITPVDLTVDTAETQRLHRLAKTIFAGLILLAALQGADLVTTRMLLTHAHTLEANPASRVLLRYYQVDVIKAVIVALLLVRAAGSRPTVAWACSVWFVCGYYVMAVLGNGLVLVAMQ